MGGGFIIQSRQRCPPLQKNGFLFRGVFLPSTRLLNQNLRNSHRTLFLPQLEGPTNHVQKNHRLSGHDEHAMTGGSVESAEPGERWELFRNLNQRSSPERRSGGYCRALTCRWIWARSAAPHLESRLLTGWNSADPTHGTSKSLDIKRRDPHIQTGKRRPRRPDRKKAFAWYLL
jgi:hypothetical protein